ETAASRATDSSVGRCCGSRDGIGITTFRRVTPMPRDPVLGRAMAPGCPAGEVDLNAQTKVRLAAFRLACQGRLRPSGPAQAARAGPSPPAPAQPPGPGPAATALSRRGRG